MLDLTAGDLAFVLAVAGLAGVVRGFSGFGAGLVMVPGLTLVLGPVVAVPTVVLLEAIAGAWLVPGAFRLARWSTVAALGLAACVGIPVGGLALAGLDPLWIQRAIGGIVLAFVAILATGWRYHGRPGLALIGATGVTSGLLTGIAGVGGPPVILFFLSGPGAAPHVRASLICYFAITQVFALGTFAVSGLLTGTVLRGCVLLVPAFLGAAWVGTHLFGKVEERTFRVLTLLLLTGLALAGLFSRPGG